MNDRYLFRGKALCAQDGLEKGDWAYGAYVPGEEKGLMMRLTDGLFPGFIEVDSTTVGQCTGLRDKGGVLIFEGDVVRTNSGKHLVKCKRGINHLIVEDSDGEWDDILEFRESRYTDYDCKEIIGNIHDNPELMEVQE